MSERAVTDRALASRTLDSHEASPVECASVLVEVGGDRGALVLHLDGGFRDREVEISGAGQSRRVHTGVLERHTAQGSVLAAVFGSLAAGSYVVWRDETTPLATVTVSGGAVTEWTSQRP